MEKEEKEEKLEYLKNVSKDVLILFAMELDLPDILNLCFTEKRIDKNICKNNSFWFNKLLKDYNIEEEVTEAKERYFLTTKELEDDPQSVFKQALRDKNLVLVKKAVKKGANVLEKRLVLKHNLYPLLESMFFEDDEIFNYLLPLTITDRKSFFDIWRDLIPVFEYLSSEEKCLILAKLFDILLPYVIEKKYLKGDKYKVFWLAALTKIEEVKEDERCPKLKAIYNKRINLYKNEAK